jgi:hypothetical protein
VNDGPERRLMLVLSMLTIWAGLILVEIVCVADVGTLATTRRLLKLWITDAPEADTRKHVGNLCTCRLSN